MQRLTGHLEEYWDATQHEAQSSPDIFDHKVFHECMVESSSQDPVDVLDERKVAFVQGILFSFVSVIQGHFFTVVYQSRMLEPEFAFQPRLLRYILSERRCKSAHNIG